MNTATAISRERLEQALAHSTFAQLLGAELLDFEPGKVSLQVRSRPDLCQHHGYLHGAVVGFMVDSGCAWAAASLVGDVVTSEYKLNLLAPAIGERLLCRAEVLKGRAAPGSLPSRCVRPEGWPGEAGGHRPGDHRPGVERIQQS